MGYGGITDISRGGLPSIAIPPRMPHLLALIFQRSSKALAFSGGERNLKSNKSCVHMNNINKQIIIYIYIIYIIYILYIIYYIYIHTVYILFSVHISV